jgi:hypothetical protein
LFCHLLKLLGPRFVVLGKSELRHTLSSSPTVGVTHRQHASN